MSPTLKGEANPPMFAEEWDDEEPDTTCEVCGGSGDDPLESYMPCKACDAEGYGPSNLLRRLEEGLTGGGYSYTAGDFEQLRKDLESSVRIANAEASDRLDAEAALEKVRQAIPLLIEHLDCPRPSTEAEHYAIDCVGNNNCGCVWKGVLATLQAALRKEGT